MARPILRKRRSSRRADQSGIAKASTRMATAMRVPGIRVRSGRTDLTPFGDFPSANCGPRRGGVLPDMVVIHYTAMASAAEAAKRLCDPATEVSAHYLIDEAGIVLAMVPEELRAWHAGAGSWGAVRDVNSHSIGIELANNGQSPFAARQMAALADLLAGIRRRWGISVERVIGHSDMAPGRKADPGARFDWRGLALAGEAVWSEAPPAEAEPAGFLAAAQAFGYPDLPADLVLAAFRLRFRPWATGPLDPADAGLACDLATRFPVDASAPGA
jgi:N-acetylmuramoyl-L-alanine amidase